MTRNLFRTIFLCCILMGYHPAAADQELPESYGDAAGAKGSPSILSSESFAVGPSGGTYAQKETVSDRKSSPSNPGDDTGPSDAVKAKLFKLDDVVVSASRRATPLKDAPASITVIDSSTIDDAPVVTPEGMLRQVAGVDTWGNELAESGFRAVTLRGLGGRTGQQRTLILLDGIPLNDTYNGWVAWSQVPIEDVQRIEVVRGPVSSLYGSWAMGGVINMITRTPSQKPVAGRLKGTYGEFDTWSAYGNLSGTTENETLGYYISGKGASSDGYLDVPESDGPFRTDNEYDLHNLTGKVIWSFDENTRLKFDGAYFREERNRGHLFSNIDPRKIKRGSISFQRDVSAGMGLLFSLYGLDEEQRVEHDDSTTHAYLAHFQEFDKPFYGAILQTSIPLTHNNTLSVGGEYRYSEATMNDTFLTVDRFSSTESKQRYYGVYGQDEAYLLDENLVLSIGARYDWWESYDGRTTDTNPPFFPPSDISFSDRTWDSFNPKLGAVYHLDEFTTFHSSLGKGYRAPSPNELYANLVFGPTLIKGNPDLGPETTYSFEVGAKRKFKNVLELRVTFYYSETDDFISTRTIDETPLFPGGPLLKTKQQENISKVRAQGVEAELYYNLTKNWYGFINYTYNESKIVEDVDPLIEGNYLGVSPPNKFNASLTYENPQLFTGTLVARFVDEYYEDNDNEVKIDSYWSFDAKLQRKIGAHANLFFAVENIFDEIYAIPSFDILQSPGRIWQVGLDLQF